ncbi:MAG: UDP-N-acetylmuramoyl-L-alanine--D-glutamate ligase [Deltaproteobacteria bacterium]|nr:UDP-N-acetylmuramoyl-L-alanine--D-glutamate ligase [Deltaproteobacteria bacterium]
MNVGNKRILVVGLGKSGLSVLRWLATQGARATVSEIKTASELDPGVLHEAKELGVIFETGGHQTKTFLSADEIIVSPGVPREIAPLMAAREKGVPVLGEMEVACRLTDTPIVAVTGTNGKSTVTAFLGSVLERAGLNVFVGGNIGTPFIDYATSGKKADYAVIEVSSFQLDTMESFHPRVAVLLNISSDHLDRYTAYSHYVASKLSIFQNLIPGDWAVLNDDDPALRGRMPDKGAKILRYGRERKKHRHAFLEREKIKAFIPGGEITEVALEKWALPGQHNRENLMAAVLASLALRIKPSVIQQAADTFRGLPHRQEFVGRIGEVTFYDDSKATNVDAACRSVAAYHGPLILIAGGRDKGGDYSPLAPAAQGKVRKAVLLGESRFLMARAFQGVVPYSMAADMQDAVNQAFSCAMPKDAVLLAPACSSFDMFTDYKHRGRVFKEAVERLRDGRG